MPTRIFTSVLKIVDVVELCDASIHSNSVHAFSHVSVNDSEGRRVVRRINSNSDDAYSHVIVKDYGGRRVVRRVNP